MLGANLRHLAGLLGRIRCLDASQPKTLRQDLAYADDTTIDPEAPGTKNLPREVASHGCVPAKARRLHARLYDDAEEAKLCAS